MNAAITLELQFFLVSILWGAILLIVYDVLRIFRRIIAHNALFIALEDIIFWVIASVFIFTMIFSLNNGTIRGFSIMGMGIGMTLYHYIFSEWVVKLISKLIQILLSPIRFVIKQIIKMYHYVERKLKKIFRFLYNRLKKRVLSIRMRVKEKKQKAILIRQEKRKLILEKKEQKRLELEKKRYHSKRAVRKREKAARKKVSTPNMESEDMIAEQAKIRPVPKKLPIQRSGSIPLKRNGDKP